MVKTKEVSRLHKKYSLIAILVYIMVLLASMSIFSFYFSQYLTGLSFYIVLFLLLLLIFVDQRNTKISILHQKQLFAFFIWVFGYIIVNQFVIQFTNSNTIMGISFNISTLQAIQVICVVVTYVYLDSKEESKIKIAIINLLLFSLFIDTIITLRALAIDPNISRIMATGLIDLNLLEIKGISGYSIIYSIVIIMPFFYLSILKSRAIYRLIFISFTLLLIYFIYNAAYTIALFALVFGFLLYSLLITQSKIKIFLLPLMLLLVIVFVDKSVMYNTLVFLSENIKIPQIALRLNELADFTFRNDTISSDTLYRLSLYQQSIDAFIKYPITGISIFNSSYPLSGHSAFLDILGGTGLLGFIPYLLFLWYSYKNALEKAKNRMLKKAIKTSYIMFCFIGCINTLATSFTIMMFLLFFVSWFPIYMRNSRLFIDKPQKTI